MDYCITHIIQMEKSYHLTKFHKKKIKKMAIIFKIIILGVLICNSFGQVIYNYFNFVIILKFTTKII